MESVSAGNGDEPLSRLLDDPGPATAARDSNTSSRRWAWRLSLGTLAATSLGFLATAVAVLLLRSAGPNPQPRRTLQRITFDEAALPRDAAWAPDGQWVVYASDLAGNAEIWKQRIGDPDPIRLTTSEANESQPQWSPDGRSIVFRSERDGGGLYVIPASGGAERIISSFGYEPSWSPDGTLLLFKRSAVLPDLPTIYVVGLDGKPPRPVRTDVLGQFKSLHAAWHPGSRRISVWGTSGAGDTRFLTVPLDGGSPTTPEIAAQVHQDLESVSAGRFAWATSRRYIYFEGRAGDTQNIWRVTVDPLTERWIDGPERLTTGAGQEANLAVSADGTRLVFTATSSRTRLWEFPFDAAAGHISGQPSPITRGSTGEVDFDVRADGSKIAYQTVRAGRNELWERSTVAGEERLLLSSTDSRLAKPLWSPDGAKLAFLRCAPRGNSLAVAVPQHRRHWRPRALTTARCPDDRFRLGQGWPGDPRRLQIQPVRAILDVHGSAFDRERARGFPCAGHRVGFKAKSLQSAILSRPALDHLSRTRSAARLDVDGLRDTCRRWSVASDDRGNVV